MERQMKPYMQWNAPEHTYRPKSNGWYTGLAIITVMLLGIAYILDNFLFGVLIIIMGFTIALYGTKRPRTVQFSLTPQGIVIDNTLYPYENIESFWVYYNPPMKKELSLHFKKRIMPQVTIPLANTNPNKIRDTLIQFVQEKKHEESFSDTLAQYFGF